MASASLRKSILREVDALDASTGRQQLHAEFHSGAGYSVPLARTGHALLAHERFSRSRALLARSGRCQFGGASRGVIEQDCLIVKVKASFVPIL